MTATEEIRRLLDERGVKWSPDNNELLKNSVTFWRMGRVVWSVIEGRDGMLLNNVSLDHLTPEQVIAATLGPGTCKLERASWDNGMCTWGCICSACDAHLEHETGIGYNFCPICGAKVVSE